MFNDYSFKAENTNNVNTAFSINAVSGTLSKRHPKSRFVIVSIKESGHLFDPENPRIFWGKETKKVSVSRVNYDKMSPFGGFATEYVDEYKSVDKEESVIVLQSMILPGEKLLCEVVLEKDFFSYKDGV